jgi:hypothetical protein
MIEKGSSRKTMRSMFHFLICLQALKSEMLQSFRVESQTKPSTFLTRDGRAKKIFGSSPIIPFCLVLLATQTGNERYEYNLNFAVLASRILSSPFAIFQTGLYQGLVLTLI